MNERELKLLHELSKTNYGKALSVFIEEETKRLDSVTSVSKGDNFELVCRGNAAAVEVLNKLFKFLKNEKVEQKAKKLYT